MSKRPFIPRKYQPGWLRKIDGRTLEGRTLHGHMMEVAEPLGGYENLTPLQRDNIERYVHVCGLIGEIEESIRKKNKRADIKLYESLLESRRRLLEHLQPPASLEPKDKDLRASFAASFEELMAAPKRARKRAPKSAPPDPLLEEHMRLAAAPAVERPPENRPLAPVVNIAERRVDPADPRISDSRVIDTSNDNRPLPDKAPWDID